MSFDPQQVAYVLSRAEPEVLDVFGPTIEILTQAVPDPSAPTVLRGTLPPGAVVPMHAHADPETFVVLSGAVEGLVYPTDGEPYWQPVRVGEMFHVPPNARHALRNTGEEPNVALVLSTREMAEFFEQMGEPVTSPDAPRNPPAPERLQRMLELTTERGDYNATPEENAAIGIELPPAP